MQAHLEAQSRFATVAIDFDGVIHAYRDGWQDGVIYDEPVDGTKDALRILAQRYKLVVFTARHDIHAVYEWLIRHSLRQYIEEVTNRKPTAAVYVDDRALKFESWDQTLEALV